MKKFYDWFHRFYGLIERNLTPSLKRAIAVLDPDSTRFSGASVLELACGSANLGLLLAPRTGRYEGRDQSTRMLERARLRWRKQYPALPGYPEPPFSEGNILETEAADIGKPDWIFISFALHLFAPADEQKILSTLFAAARKGVIIIDHAQEWDPFLAWVERLEGSHFDEYIRMDFRRLAADMNAAFRQNTEDGMNVMEFLKPQAE